MSKQEVTEFIETSMKGACAHGLINGAFEGTKNMVASWKRTVIETLRNVLQSPLIA